MCRDRRAGCQRREEYREKLRAAVLKLMDAGQLDALAYPDVEQSAAAHRRSQHAWRGQQPAVLAEHRLSRDYRADGLYARRLAAGGPQLLGRPWSEPTLLKLAYSYEQAHPPSPPASGYAAAAIRGRHTVGPYDRVARSALRSHGRLIAIGLAIVGRVWRRVFDIRGSASAPDSVDPCVDSV